MSTIYQLERDNGLDLLLHTPGGDLAATEAIVTYLREMFEDIRVVVPQLAMSAGTMMALAADEIVMGKHSSLGPIDPQVNGTPAHGIIEEFENGAAAIRDSEPTGPLYAQIIDKYGPALVGQCRKAVAWAEDLVEEWLATRMREGDPDAEDKIEKIKTEFGDHALTKSHARHLSADQADDAGLVVTKLEDDDELQDAVLSVHHAFQQTIASTPTAKIIENHNGIAHIERSALPE